MILVRTIVVSQEKDDYGEEREEPIRDFEQPTNVNRHGALDTFPHFHPPSSTFFPRVIQGLHHRCSATLHLHVDHDTAGLHPPKDETTKPKAGAVHLPVNAHHGSTPSHSSGTRSENELGITDIVIVHSGKEGMRGMVSGRGSGSGLERGPDTREVLGGIERAMTG